MEKMKYIISLLRYSIELHYVFVPLSRPNETVFDYLNCTQFKKSFELIDLSTA